VQPENSANPIKAMAAIEQFFFIKQVCPKIEMEIQQTKQKTINTENKKIFQFLQKINLNTSVFYNRRLIIAEALAIFIMITCYLFV
jgi:hypothetical protein